MWFFEWFFVFFLKTTIQNFFKLGQNVVHIVPERLQKTAHQNHFPFLRYSSSKLVFFVIIAKIGSKDRPISPERKMVWKIWFDIQNLQEISFPDHPIRFFIAPRLHGVILTWKWPILTLKIIVFEGFWGISRQSTWPIGPKLRMKKAYMRLERMKKTAVQNHL